MYLNVNINPFIQIPLKSSGLGTHSLPLILDISRKASPNSFHSIETHQNNNTTPKETKKNNNIPPQLKRRTTSRKHHHFLLVCPFKCKPIPKTLTPTICLNPSEPINSHQSLSRFPGSHRSSQGSMKNERLKGLVFVTSYGAPIKWGYFTPVTYIFTKPFIRVIAPIYNY